MPRYEYKVIPAPAKGRKAKGVKTPEARFALAVEDVLNQMGAEGWDYLRAELLPSDERSGLTGSTQNWRNVLVFRRPLEGDVEAFQPRLIEAPDPTVPAVRPESWPVDPQEPKLQAPAKRAADEDNGVEDTEESTDLGPALTARAQQARTGKAAAEAEDDGPEGSGPDGDGETGPDEKPGGRG